ncbi:MAG: hypothetical protein J0I20_02160 [Chloroflexi bacterium]|nr:hypothetical protein [Chloroflexota bacterium]OJV89426.1 MAG: hypothetical protein BGO39_36220 [Chloroflexi bacterium 54-19]
MLQDTNVDLPCGCKIKKNQVIVHCERGAQLNQERKLASKNGSSNKAERAALNYEEHFTEQFETMEFEY